MNSTLFFEELLYGTGAWFGLVLVLGIIVFVTSMKKLTGVLFMPVCVFLSIHYFRHVADNDMFMWGGIIMMITAIYCLGVAISSARRG